MILWAIQSKKAWEQLQQDGVLRPKVQNVEPKDFIPAYKWMVKQMKQSLGKPIFYSSDSVPLWGWYQINGHRKKPDLRESGHLPRGEEGVCIEFEVKDSQALLSDFEAWHFALNYWFLGQENEVEKLEKALEKRNLSFYENKPLPNRYYHCKLQNSWKHIFDDDWIKKWHSEESASIQATLWELKLKDVKKHRHFLAK